MDADRLPVLNNPQEEVQQQHSTVLPTEKQDYDDIKEKTSENGAGYQQTTLDIESVDQHYIPGDPLPMDPNLPEEHAQFTIRAVFVGLCLGAVVQVSFGTLCVIIRCMVFWRVLWRISRRKKSFIMLTLIP